ncbi:protein snakeskin [Aethina tumida]|uniref:protein snakeskin n=1 Tax=Aethina tumida TaxID=116153 RepID=UPI002148C342|nr:protein snakeskin [Aethina tumida]
MSVLVVLYKKTSLPITMVLITIGILVLGIVKVVINLIVLIMYRVGNQTKQDNFLGVGGSWNLYDEKYPDAEILASGVLVGYMIYTIVSVINTLLADEEFKTSFTDILMKVVGVFLWFAVAGTAIHYWKSYSNDNKALEGNEKQIGLAMGSLCVINGVVYFGDAALSILFFFNTKMGSTA